MEKEEEEINFSIQKSYNYLSKTLDGPATYIIDRYLLIMPADAHTHSTYVHT